MTVGAHRSGSGKPQGSQFRFMLFDLDDTLYRQHLIPEQVRKSIEEYMVSKLGTPQSEVKAKTTSLYMKYGTTLAGLVAEGNVIDYEDWHQHVHWGVIPYDALLKPDPSLREILMSIDLPKYIVTNADRKHALVCLEKLGIKDCFHPHMFDFEFAQKLAAEHGLSTPEHPSVLCKPQPALYKWVLEHIGAQPSEVIFFDDSIRNLQTAHNLGMFTVLVGQAEAMAGANLALLDLHALPRAMPELVDQPGLIHDDRSSQHSSLIAVEV